MAGGGRCIRRVVLVCLPAIVLLSLAFSAPVALALQDTQARNEKDTAGADPTGQTMGVYVTSLRDFDTTGDSFGVDYWLWSVHPPGNDPLNKVEFVNAKQVDIRLDQSFKRHGEIWSRQKVRATVLQDWDLSNFPFDRQVLKLDLRLADSTGVIYRPDKAESGYARNATPDGWRITDFDIDEKVKKYETTFGDPEASGGSSQDHVIATLRIERENATGFFKMIAGVYAAIAIGCLSFLMAPNQPTVFSGRMTLLAAALFAIVVNLQVSDSVLGSLEDIALVHKIHILAMAYVFVAALLTVLARKGYDSGHKDRANRRDLIGLCVFSLTFIAFNVALIAAAAATG